MSKPIPIVAAETACRALETIEAEYADLDTRREAVEQHIRSVRAMVLPRTEAEHFSSRPKW